MLLAAGAWLLDRRSGGRLRTGFEPEVPEGDLVVPTIDLLEHARSGWKRRVGGQRDRIGDGLGRLRSAASEAEASIRYWTVAGSLFAVLVAVIEADAEVVLYRGDVNQDDRKLVEHTLGEVDRMNAVLSDLLLVARLDASKLEIAAKPFDLAVALSEETERFAARAASKGVHLEVVSPDRLPVRGDRERTGQILAVLLDNAVKATPSGGRITVEGRPLGRWTEARVTDTGPGITPEHLPRIFDRFYKIEAARSRGEGGGTGLGLAIPRELARVQKGELRAENAPDHGAVFRLQLPRGQGGI